MRGMPPRACTTGVHAMVYGLWQRAADRND
jgi:hypothetical protein